MASSKAANSGFTAKESLLLVNFLKHSEDKANIDWTKIAQDSQYNDEKGVISALQRLKNKIFKENTLVPLKIPSKSSDEVTTASASENATATTPKKTAGPKQAAGKNTASKKVTSSVKPAAKKDMTRKKTTSAGDDAHGSDEEDETKEPPNINAMTTRGKGVVSKSANKAKRPAPDVIDGKPEESSNESGQSEVDERDSKTHTSSHTPSKHSNKKRKLDTATQETKKQTAPTTGKANKPSRSGKAAHVLLEDKGDEEHSNVEAPSNIKKAPAASKASKKVARAPTSAAQGHEDDDEVEFIEDPTQFSTYPPRKNASKLQEVVSQNNDKEVATSQQHELSKESKVTKKKDASKVQANATASTQGKPAGKSKITPRRAEVPDSDDDNANASGTLKEKAEATVQHTTEPSTEVDDAAVNELLDEGLHKSPSKFSDKDNHNFVQEDNPGDIEAMSAANDDRQAETCAKEHGTNDEGLPEVKRGKADNDVSDTQAAHYDKNGENLEEIEDVDEQQPQQSNASGD